MDAIDLMAIKPWQIREALGGDCVKVIRGSRRIYNARQNRLRTCDNISSESQESGEIKQIWTCTDLACGGVIKRRLKVRKAMTDNVCQTDSKDMEHYWQTKEELEYHNVTVVTGKPRDIQDGAHQQFERKGSNISILQRGSVTSVGAQTNPAGNKEKKKSKAAIFFSNKLQSMKKFFKNFILPPQPLSEEDTSSSEQEGMPENEAEERDHEWLEHTESELSRDDMQAAYEANLLESPPPPRRIELECHNLISPITPLLWLLKLGGRWPFETYIEDRLVKFRLNRWSPNFMLFLLTTLFLTVFTSQGIVSTISLISAASDTHGYEQNKMEILFNKYWVFAFITFFYTLYASTWSLAAMFDDGRFLAEFMSRWNLGVVSIKYNTSEGVRTDLWLSLGWLIFYFISLTCFYIWDMIPAVRGTSELLGMLMLRPFIAEGELIQHGTAIGIFGFIFHLYAAYSTRIITLMALMYCKFLENLARRWNLRFCYVAGMLGRFEPPHRYITYHTVIPYTKLFQEHKLILALSRYTGKVFSIALLTYYLTKGLEMLLLSYVTCSELIFTEPGNDETETINNSLPCPKDAQNCQPIKAQDELVFVAMTLFYFMGQSISGWYMTTESITSCGAAVMSGFNFVRRYGFPRCKNSKERRFIQSLVFAFSPISNYYINCGFTINRKFTYEMFAWVFAFTSMLVAFSPFQLDVKPFAICTTFNDTPTCHVVHLKRVERVKVLEDFAKKGIKSFEVFNDPNKFMRSPTTTVKPAPPSSLPTPPPPPTPLPRRPAAPPPVNVPPYKMCEKPGGGHVFIPVGCNKTVGSILHPFYKTSPGFTGGVGCYDQNYPDHTIYTEPYQKKPPGLYYCTTLYPKVQIEVNLDPLNRDDCGNLPFSPDGTIPKKTEVEVTMTKGTKQICCCYDYPWYKTLKPKTTAKKNNCAMSSEAQADKFCKGKCKPCP